MMMMMMMMMMMILQSYDDYASRISLLLDLKKI